MIFIKGGVNAKIRLVSFFSYLNYLVIFCRMVDFSTNFSYFYIYFYHNFLKHYERTFSIDASDVLTRRYQDVWQYTVRINLLKSLPQYWHYSKKTSVIQNEYWDSLLWVLFIQGDISTLTAFTCNTKHQILNFNRYSNIRLNTVFANYNSFYPTLRSLNLLKYFKQDAIISDFLIRFLEYLFGCRVSLFIWTKLQMLLPLADVMCSFLLFQRIFYSMSASSLSLWQGFAECVLLVAVTKDVRFLISWIRLRLRGMSLFRHGRFFQLILYYLRYFLVAFGLTYGIVGFRLDVRGKISVTGNARKRIILFKHGLTSFRNVSTKVISDFFLIRTDTGCLGVTIWIFYR